LLECFEKCTRSDKVDKKTAKFSAKTIVEKSANLYISPLTKWFKETHTGKGGEDYLANSFRLYLTSPAGVGEVKNKPKMAESKKSKAIIQLTN